MTQSIQRVWFITGASTGFGRLLAEEVLRTGGKVIATARKLDKVGDLEAKYPKAAKALALDVTDAGQVGLCSYAGFCAVRPGGCAWSTMQAMVSRVLSKRSRRQSLCRCLRRMSRLLKVTRAFLPYLRKHAAGHVLNLSSIGGLIGGQGIGMYNATKFAVEGLSEALAAELAPLGIHVTVIEPGPFRTDFLGRSGVIAETRIKDYDNTAGNMRKYFSENDGKQKGDPLRAVQAMIQVVESPNPPLHLLLGVSALQRMRAKLDNWQKEIAAWEPVNRWR